MEDTMPLMSRGSVKNRRRHVMKDLLGKVLFW